MLTIAQIFNNNCALVDIGESKQAIVRGKGIAFKKNKGESIDSAKVEKIFYLETKESKENLFFLLKDIPINVVTTTYEIIDYAKEKYNYQVLNYVYITLSDHINGVYQRFLSRTYVESLVPDMSNQYKIEYEIGQKGLAIINSNLNIRLPKSEVKSLALHFINGQGNEEKSIPMQKDKTLKINDVVKNVLNEHSIFRNSENGNYFDRFMIHLQYLSNRLDDKKEDNEEFNEKLKVDLKMQYPISFKIAQDMYKGLETELNKKLSGSELLYFIIHIQRLTHEESQ